MALAIGDPEGALAMAPNKFIRTVRSQLQMSAMYSELVADVPFEQQNLLVYLTTCCIFIEYTHDRI